MKQRDGGSGLKKVERFERRIFWQSLLVECKMYVSLGCCLVFIEIER